MVARHLGMLLGTASLLAIGHTGSAEAQQGAQPAASSSSGLEEIVVTARRREERAQTVPITMTTFTQQAIEQQEIRTLNDLERDVPGFTLCCSPGQPVFAWIRGVTGVIGYFAQAPVDLYGSSLYFDQASLEVLKGPQGTLFGLSTNGGALVFEPKAPENAFGGFVQAEVGDYGHEQIQAVVNVPIIEDKVLLRVGFEQNKTDGYIHDLSTNKDLANEDFWIGRASVTLRPTDDLQNTTIVNYYHSQNNFSSQDFIPYQVNPNVTFAQIPLPIIGNVPLTLGNGPALSALTNPATSVATFLQLLATKNAGGKPSLSFYPNIQQIYDEQRKLGWYTILGTNVPGGPYRREERWNIVNTTTWDITDDFTLKNVASYQEIQQRAQSDTDMTPLDLLDQSQASPAEGPEVQYTDDLQLQGKLLKDKLSFTLGVFEFLSWPQVTFAQGAYFAGRGPHTIQYNCTLSTCTGEVQVSHRNTTAIYGQGTYNLSDLLDGLSVTGGYRYTWDSVYQYDASYNSDGTLKTGVGANPTSAYATFQAPSLLGSLQYQITPNTMVYFSFSKGFSSGGFNAGDTTPYAKEYKPERLKNYEIGIKSDFDLAAVDLQSVKVRTNVSAYYGEYENIKQNITALTSQGLSVLTINVASAYVEGVEGQFTIVPVESVELGLNVSWNHVAFEHFIDPISGADFSRAPQSYNPYWQYNIHATYHLPVDKSYGDIAFTAVLDYQGKRSNTIILPQIPQNIDPDFYNLDMNLEWRDIWGKTGLNGRLWVTNLLENVSSEGSLAAYQSLGIYDRSVARPRMYGLTMRYEFGG